MRFALLVLGISYCVDARYVRHPHPKRADLIESFTHSPGFKSFFGKSIGAFTHSGLTSLIRKTIDSVKDVPGLSPTIANSLETIETAPGFVTAMGKIFETFHDPHNGMVPAVFHSLEILIDSPEVAATIKNVVAAFESIPEIRHVLYEAIMAFENFTGLSSISNYLMGQLDWVFEQGRRKLAREIIIHQMDKCQEIGNANVFEVAVEVMKYKDFETGPKMRKETAERCYNKVRRKVAKALKKGYIKAVENPPCQSGWGTFEIYEKGKNSRYINPNRYLPCLDTEKETKTNNSEQEPETNHSEQKPETNNSEQEPETNNSEQEPETNNSEPEPEPNDSE